MATQQKKPIALFPDVPRDARMMRNDGRMSDDWYTFFDQLILALQTNLKPEGFVIPPQTAANILLLVNESSNNNIIYDSTINKFRGNENGSWKTFTTT